VWGKGTYNHVAIQLQWVNNQHRQPFKKGPRYLPTVRSGNLPDQTFRLVRVLPHDECLRLLRENPQPEHSPNRTTGLFPPKNKNRKSPVAKHNKNPKCCVSLL
jgi:hypothetical protein